MSDAKLTSVIVFGSDADLPAGAGELFGREVEAAWSARPGAGDAEVVAPLPFVLGVLDEQDRFAAGVFLLIEDDDSPESEHDGHGAAGKARGAPPASPDVSRSQRVASIRQLVVRPEHRGKGLAGKLIRAALEAGRKSGCPRIRSTAGWGCPDHLFMYERLGFRRALAADRPYLVSRSTQVT